jgi:hypothetical protein
MLGKAVERWQCGNPACRSEVLVEANVEVRRTYPRCSCGGALKKNYSPPALRNLDFLYLHELILANTLSGEE